MQPIKVELDQPTRDFYVRTLTVLNESAMPYLIGGAYAMGTLAGIERHTKDIDVFARESDCDRILRVFEGAGYRTEVTFPHWLATENGRDIWSRPTFRQTTAFQGCSPFSQPTGSRFITAANTA